MTTITAQPADDPERRRPPKDFALYALAVGHLGSVITLPWLRDVLGAIADALAEQARDADKRDPETVKP